MANTRKEKELRRYSSPIGHNNTMHFFVPCKEPAFAWPFENGLVRIGTQGLFRPKRRPCLKAFIAPFHPTRLTATGSPRMVDTWSRCLIMHTCARACPHPIPTCLWWKGKPGRVMRFAGNTGKYLYTSRRIFLDSQQFLSKLPLRPRMTLKTFLKLGRIMENLISVSMELNSGMLFKKI